MSDIELIQKKLLEMMRWFHSFCEKNGIKYYVLGGTMLGAVRHKGFIPWDDDIDVGLPRKDYIKLINLKVDTQKYKIESPLSTDKDYCFPFSKIYDTETTLIENTCFKLKRGLYIDVFPLDYIADKKSDCIKKYKRIKLLHNIVVLRNLPYKADRKLINKIVWRAVHLLPEFILSTHMMCRRLDKYGYDELGKDFKYGGNLFGQWGKKELMPAEVMGEPQLYKFEDMEVFGAENYNEYLTRLYGDWQKMPPQEKRVSHHDFLKFDINKSYLEEL